LWEKELENLKIFLFFSDFGRGYLRVWPKPYLVKREAYLVLRRAKKRDLDADFARLTQIYADFFGGKRIDKKRDREYICMKRGQTKNLDTD